jgi:hypothetical protein
MPCLKGVTRVVELDQTLNLFSGQVRNGCRSRLPPKNTEPANNVAEELLAAWRCEFADPMVLSAGCWCPEDC